MKYVCEFVCMFIICVGGESIYIYICTGIYKYK